MPRVLLATADTAGAVPFYSIDGTVGRGGQNERLDVMLVQYMVRKVVDTIPAVRPSVSTTSAQLGLRAAVGVVRQPGAAPMQNPVPNGPLVIDGLCGGQTIAFIDFFQQFATTKRYHPAAVPGMVGPPGTPAQMTLLALNGILQNAIGDKIWFLFADSLFPPQLSPVLYTSSLPRR